MRIETQPEWQQLALYGFGGAILLLLLFNIPRIGPVVRAAFSLALLAFALFVLFQHAPYDPNLARLSASLGFNNQQVVGDEVRIRMSPDGHFWAQVAINGAEGRMLIDSGATVTALSERTARLARVDLVSSPLPVAVKRLYGERPVAVTNLIARDVPPVSHPAITRVLG